MYKKFDSPLLPNIKLCQGSNICKELKEKDIVTMRAEEDVEFNILVETLDSKNINGTIEEIIPDSKKSYMGWSCGDKINVDKQFVAMVHHK